MPRQPNACRRCARPLSHGDVCGSCLLSPPPWIELRCAVPYQPPFDELFAQLKFGGRTDVASALSCLLLETLSTPLPASVFETQDGAAPDIIVPIPLHWTRLWQRGFNQSDLLAAPLARAMNRPVIHALRRVRRTAPQTLTKPSERHANVRHAFVPRRSVNGQRIAVLDDVVTTGATVRAATQTLLNAGAISVCVWAVARAYTSRRSR